MMLVIDVKFWFDATLLFKTWLLIKIYSVGMRLLGIIYFPVISKILLS